MSFEKKELYRKLFSEDISTPVFFEPWWLDAVCGSDNWDAALRYDKMKKRLFIKPHVEAPANQKDLGQGDILVNVLLMALSDIEYPIDINNLRPITTSFNDKIITIITDIYDIYTEKDKLFIEIIPNAKVSD